MIYLDNNATTGLSPDAAEAMLPFMKEAYGNPSSVHSAGREASNAISGARQAVAELLGTASADEIVFTSGGTESDNWAILGALQANSEKRHIVTTRVEHEAVRKLAERLENEGCAVTWIEVDETGTLDVDAFSDAVTADTAVVSVMLANNETGVIFPVEKLAAIVKERSSALFHVDGVNAAGKIKIDLKNTEIDLFSISGHKFHGPKGIGALYIRREASIPPFMTGGGQEAGRRAGTEAVHQIAGIGAAAKLVTDLGPMVRVSRLHDRLENGILNKFPYSRLNGTSDAAIRLSNTSNISFENMNGEMIASMLDDAGICVSTGSACNSDDHTASPVLQAMNIPYSLAMGSIRFSLGRNNTEAEVDEVLDALDALLSKLEFIAGRRAAPES
ncbi:MAG TPA: aminotransferase class V-fold PLP-dependent enzyme [Pyrinomonadaceae bacterium]|nr:aminotransferase class V-fold PLP-dependent enzyme [Pyrinomonadaceae bacterium]